MYRPQVLNNNDLIKIAEKCFLPSVGFCDRIKIQSRRLYNN